MFYPYEELEFIETKGSRYIAQTAVVAGQHVAQQQQRRVMAVAQPTAPTRLWAGENHRDLYPSFCSGLELTQASM